MGNSSSSKSAPHDEIVQHNESLEEELASFFSDNISYARDFIEICNKHNVEIIGEDPHTVLKTLVLITEDGVEIKVDAMFLEQDNLFPSYMHHNNGGHFEDILETWNQLPSFYKSSVQEIELQGISISQGASYNGMGKVTIPGAFLEYGKDTPEYIKGVLIHEVGHSLDLGSVKSITNLEEFKSVINNGMTSSKGFKDIISHEYSSEYSRWYNPKSDHFGPNQELQSLKYPSESFAEAMKITGKMKLLGSKNAYIEMPVFNNYGMVVDVRKVNYDTWKEINPNMAKIAEQVWDSGSKEKASKIMQNAEYDSSLKSKPLTSSDYEKRSERYLDF